MSTSATHSSPDWSTSPRIGEALAALDVIAYEPEFIRKYSLYFAYEFILARRTD